MIAKGSRRVRVAAAAMAVLSSLLHAGCLAPAPNPEPGDIVGVWVHDEKSNWGEPGGEISFEADGTFVATGIPEHFLLRNDSEQPADASGTWSISEASTQDTLPTVRIRNKLSDTERHGTQFSAEGSGEGMRLRAWYDLDRGDFYILRKR